MIIKYPIAVSADKDRYAYLYRLYELVRLDGNANGWTEKREDGHDLIIKEMLKYRAKLKNDNTNPAKLSDIDGY